MRPHTHIVTLICLLALPCAPQPMASGEDDAAWEQLRRTVQARSAELDALIREADSKGINTDYASVSQFVLSVFQLAAAHDREHVEDVRKIFNSFAWRTKTDPAAADKLAVEEMKACVEVADYAMAELRQQLDGKVTLGAPPDFSQGKMTVGNGFYSLNGRPAFPSSLVWLPEDEGYMQEMGRIGGGFYQLTFLDEDGTLQPRPLKDAIESTRWHVGINAAPLAHLIGHAPAKWMLEKHPEINQGARNFTKYDIDNPRVRQWISYLCEAVVPEISKAAGDQPQIHLLANEPHFATQEGGWLANNGLSELTMQKYRKWIAAKYETVDALNATYGTSFAGLDDVNVEIPIDPALRGGPVWYDWCRFNMDRVNDWFTFLKQETQRNDPKHSPVSIKMLGFLLDDPLRDHGMDMEYLTRLQDVPGADLRVMPRGATLYGNIPYDEETGWPSRYAYLWVEQSMYLDFTKSLCPDKPFYDSEWHGFGAGAWRDYNMRREYVRSSIWLAFSHGMGMINPWLWGRGLDGALSPKSDHIGELSTQPVAMDAFGRVMKELNAHSGHVAAAVPQLRRFLIYYCEEAAIQNADYAAHFTEVYEALKLLNVTVGFVTPTDVGKLDPETQTVVVTPTEFISDQSLSALQSFARSNGRIVMAGAENNFLKTEMGAARTGDAALPTFASVPMKPVLQMADDLRAALAPITPALPLDVEITDQHESQAYGLIMNQAVHPQSGAISIVLNNVSKDPRIVTFKPRAGQTGRFLDVITKKPGEATIVMPPCDVRVFVLLP